MNVLIKMIVDGKNAVLGRFASHVAKALLKGEDVTVVNAEKVIITGSPRRIVEKYTARRQRGSTEKGPYFPKSPDAIFRKGVRGMLPFKTDRGREAFKRLRVHVDIPEEMKGRNISAAAVKEIKTSFITLGELAKSIGWRDYNETR